MSDTPAIDILRAKYAAFPVRPIPQVGLSDLTALISSRNARRGDPTNMPVFPGSLSPAQKLQRGGFRHMPGLTGWNR